MGSSGGGGGGGADSQQVLQNVRMNVRSNDLMPALGQDAAESSEMSAQYLQSAQNEDEKQKIMDMISKLGSSGAATNGGGGGGGEQEIMRMIGSYIF